MADGKDSPRPPTPGADLEEDLILGVCKRKSGRRPPPRPALNWQPAVIEEVQKAYGCVRFRFQRDSSHQEVQTALGLEPHCLEKSGWLEVGRIDYHLPLPFTATDRRGSILTKLGTSPCELLWEGDVVEVAIFERDEKQTAQQESGRNQWLATNLRLPGGNRRYLIPAYATLHKVPPPAPAGKEETEAKPEAFSFRISCQYSKEEQVAMEEEDGPLEDVECFSPLVGWGRIATDARVITYGSKIVEGSAILILVAEVAPRPPEEDFTDPAEFHLRIWSYQSLYLGQVMRCCMLPCSFSGTPVVRRRAGTTVDPRQFGARLAEKDRILLLQHCALAFIDYEESVNLRADRAACFKADCILYEDSDARDLAELTVRAEHWEHAASACLLSIDFSKYGGLTQGLPVISGRVLSSNESQRTVTLHLNPGQMELLDAARRRIGGDLRLAEDRRPVDVRPVLNPQSIYLRYYQRHIVGLLCARSSSGNIARTLLNLPPNEAGQEEGGPAAGVQAGADGAAGPGPGGRGRGPGGRRGQGGPRPPPLCSTPLPIWLSEQKLGRKLTGEQAAVVSAITECGKVPENNILIVAGSPGSAKTYTCAAALIAHLCANPTAQILVIAKTNYATTNFFQTVDSLRRQLATAEDADERLRQIRPLRICSLAHAAKSNFSQFQNPPLHLQVERALAVADAAADFQAFQAHYGNSPDDEETLKGFYEACAGIREAKKELAQLQKQAKKSKKGKKANPDDKGQAAQLKTRLAKLRGQLDGYWVAQVRPNIVCLTADLSKFFFLSELCLQPTLLLIDESSLVSRDMALWSIGQCGRELTGLVLVGDRVQLPPHSFLSGHARAVGTLSVLDVLEKIQGTRRIHPLPLSVSFRLTPCMVHALRVFYPHMNLSTAKTNTLSIPFLFPFLEKTARSIFIHVPGEAKARPGTTSLQNEVEVQVVQTLLRWLFDHGVRPSQLMLSTFYRSQLRCFKELLKGMNMGGGQVHVATIDGQIGQEADCCIVSLVRSNPAGSPASIGFAASIHRLVVAMSRASQGLIIVGNFHTYISALRLLIQAKRGEEQVEVKRALHFFLELLHCQRVVADFLRLIDGPQLAGPNWAEEAYEDDRLVLPPASLIPFTDEMATEKRQLEQDLQESDTQAASGSSGAGQGPAGRGGRRRGASRIQSGRPPKQPALSREPGSVAGGPEPMELACAVPSGPPTPAPMGDIRPQLYPPPPPPPHMAVGYLTHPQPPPHYAQLPVAYGLGGAGGGAMGPRGPIQHQQQQMMRMPMPPPNYIPGQPWPVQPPQPQAYPMPYPPPHPAAGPPPPPPH